MAETAPLSMAHAHARKAARETQLNNWIEAADEHGLAAADFARASRSTADSEALRILRLLEEQHLRLARSSRKESEKPATPSPNPKSKSKSPSATAPPSPSPSLAREMASRRGIPATSRSPLVRSSTTPKTQTQEEMELENLTLKQTLEGLVGENNGLKDTNARLEEANAKNVKMVAAYQARWVELKKSAQERDKAKREKAAAKDKESSAGG